MDVIGGWMVQLGLPQQSHQAKGLKRVTLLRESQLEKQRSRPAKEGRSRPLAGANRGSLNRQGRGSCERFGHVLMLQEDAVPHLNMILSEGVISELTIEAPSSCAL